jgi:predicted RNase H-like HicB family nuclease
MMIDTDTRDKELEARVEAWLPDDFDFRVATKREDGEWFALAVDFDVTGKGATRSAAVRQMGELLGLYLATYLIDNASFTDAVRPVPTRMRLRIQAEDAVSRIMRHVDGKIPLSRENNYILPVSEVAAHARC